MSDTAIKVGEVATGGRGTARAGLAGVLVAVLVGGSALVAGAPDGPYDQAADLIAGHYADGSAEDFIAAWDPRFTAQFEDRIEQLRADVASLFTQGATVVGEVVVPVAGVPLVAVTTSDQIRWCVRPDGVILPTCVLGTMTATVDASTLGLRADVLGGGLDLDGAEITFDLLPTGTESFTFAGPGEVVGDSGGWQVVAATQLADGQFFPPAEDGSLTVGGAFSVRVTLHADLGGGGQPSATSFGLEQPEGTIRITIPGPGYWFN